MAPFIPWMGNIASEVQRSMVELSRVLNIRVDKVLDAYLSFSPTKVRILEIVEEGDEVVGLRLSVQSDTRRDVWHYVTVGKYGGKCTCEGRIFGGKLCKHVIIGLVSWNMVSIIRRGKKINFDELAWLREEKERT